MPDRFKVTKAEEADNKPALYPNIKDEESALGKLLPPANHTAEKKGEYKYLINNISIHHSYRIPKNIYNFHSPNKEILWVLESA